MAGRKVFQAATVLTAADVNNYLMDQSVMVFANSTARASAIGTPTAGMVSFLEDSSSLQVYGTAWANVTNPGDITAVTAGTGLTGGGTSGDVTLNVNYSQVIPTSVVTTTGDLIVANGNASVTRLGIGSNGQALVSNGTTAVWGTPSSTPTYDSWSSLASGSIGTGSATFSITGFAARDKYLLIINNISATGQSGNVDVSIRINGDSGNITSAYGLVEPAASYSTGIVNDDVNNYVLGAMSTNAASTLSGGTLIQAARATSSSPKLIDFWGAGSASGGNAHRFIVGKGMYTGTAAVTSIDIRLSGVGVTIDAGTYTLYGAD